MYKHAGQAKLKMFVKQCLSMWPGLKSVQTYNSEILLVKVIWSTTWDLKVRGYSFAIS